MDCYDISKYAIAICLILYGKDERFQFFHKSFETLFFIGNSSVKGNVEPIYDLVIGNPPYSEYSGKYAGLGEKKYTKATNYIDYFIFRSLDLLKSGGLLVYILGSVKGMGQDNWLESKDNYTKEKIKEKAELVDALRLGSGVFEFTDVDSDIIVLRKK
jgi:tRNA1(Val) A37 N6-methylase TrmN6